MTDKELLQQLLRRNHQLTAKCEGLTKRIEHLEGKHPPRNDRLAAMHEALDKKVQIIAETRPSLDVLNQTLATWDRTLDDIWHKVQILSVIVDWTVEKLDGDFEKFYDEAENVVNKGRLQCQFEEPTTDAEDGHS